MVTSIDRALTSSVAMYYYNIGVGNYTFELGKEMMNLIKENEQSTRLTHEDIQECWEVYLYLKTSSGYGIDKHVKRLPVNYLGNGSFVREWNTEMANFNITILYQGWLSLQETKGKLEDNIEKYQKMYGSYKRLTGKNLYLCLPREESIKHLTELSIDSKSYTDNKVFTKQYLDYYKDVVYYEVGDVLDALIKYKTVKFKSITMRVKYFSSSSKYNTKMRVFLKGLLMYVDLINGYDWGREWEYR